MPDEAFTFSELRKIQKEESRQDELTEREDDFLLKVADYLERKKDLNGKDREYRNAKRVFDKIISLREDKIVKNARLSVKSDMEISDLDLLPTEQELFLDVKEKFEEHWDRVEDRVERDSDVENSAEPEENADKEDNVEEEVSGGPEEDTGEDDAGDGVRIEITSQVPEFMGTDLKSYGPFEEGEEATVPEENAEILVNRGSAREVEKMEEAV